MVRELAASGEDLNCPPEQAYLRASEDVAELPGLAPDEVAMLQFAARLTLWNRSMRREHLEPLRAAGFDEQAIHDLVQVICCYNFMNRMADAFGVEINPKYAELADEMYGEGAAAAHQKWARRDPDVPLPEESEPS